MQVPREQSLPETLKHLNTSSSRDPGNTGSAKGQITNNRGGLTSAEQAGQSTDQESELLLKIEELEASNTALHEALTTVAHELRTPLASIVAYADLLLRNRNGSLSPKELQQLTILRRNAGLLDFLIRDLTEMARMSSGVLPIRPGVFDASEMIQDACESVRPFFDARMQTLNILPLPPETWVAGDSIRLRQVVANLLTNAAKFSPRSSQIDIEGEVDSSKLLVRVIDHGIGIALEDHGKLFSSFFQSGGQRSDGLGLGLYIARSIVEAHGGRMSVESEKGLGTTMSFAIPRISSGHNSRPGSGSADTAADRNSRGTSTAL